MSIDLVSLVCVCVCAGYYWIDPNIGSKQDAIQVFCGKPGCSCIDYTLPDSSAPAYYADAGEKSFSELSDGYEVREKDLASKLFFARRHCWIEVYAPPLSPHLQLTWPVQIDQITMLQLLSSHATQEFRFHGSKRVDFVDADGEPLHADDDEMTAVSPTHELSRKTISYSFPLSYSPSLSLSLSLSPSFQMKSRTDYMLSGEPEKFPIVDFTPHDSTFGFEMGKACFCNELQ